jgi:hypothetical protein
MEDVDITEFADQDTSQVINAIDAAASQNEITWLTEDGRRVAAVVPVDVAEAHEQWLANVLASSPTPEPGSRVRVSADTGAAWQGTVVCVVHEPAMLLETASGRRLLLPLSHRIQRV